ncbi:MAG: hypothetical protein DLM70_02620 [Chloroflexi bacterium]|nr:MAG: hypothetical protein DLM70_02620 [Chloroflexota bacterium]
MTLTIRAQETADDEAALKIRNGLEPETQVTRDEYRDMLAKWPADVIQVTMAAEQDGRIVGAHSLKQKFWVHDPSSFIAGITVERDLWERGIGSALYEDIVERAQKVGAKRIFARFRDGYENTRPFLEHRGVLPTGSVHKSTRLDLRHVNFEGYETLPERLAREGIRVETLAKVASEDESRLHEVYDVDLETAKDEPGSEPFSMSFDRWLAMMVHGPGTSPESVFVALAQEQVIGYTMVGRLGPDGGESNGMGVLREYRGRGVARLLKLATIEWARANGLRYLHTGNDVNNPRMYAINVRLGYQSLPDRVEVVKELESA